MGKSTFKGLVPPDDPMFSGSYQVFSPHGSRRLTQHSPPNTDTPPHHVDAGLMLSESATALDTLMNPPRLWTRAEVLSRPSPVPRAPGVYAWYFDSVPERVPTTGCRRHEGSWLLYVGISSGRSRTPDASGGRQTLFTRVRAHFRGNAEGSTLRRTLGCLLADTLGIELRRVGNGQRMTFADGEARLDAWMDAHARVAWVAHPEPRTIEHLCLESLSLPLNLESNTGHPFHAPLTELRRAARQAAHALPIVSARGQTPLIGEER